jgi:hypothetical protein
MAVVKLNSTGKQIQFVDEEGNMFVTSAAFMMGLLQGRSPTGFLLLSRYPNKVAKGRFKESPLWDPSGLAKKNEEKPVTLTNDSLSRKSLEQGKEKKAFADKKVW